MAHEDAVTPNRLTTATFDIDETVLIAEPYGFVRKGIEVAKPAALGIADDVNAFGMHFWKSRGCWTLGFAQSDVSNLHEYTEFQSLIIPDTAGAVATYAGIAAMTVIATMRQDSDLPGMVYAGTIQSYGDQYLIKTVPAGKNWASVHPSTYPQVSGIGLDVPIDRMFETSSVFPTDQGFFLRWTVPGTGSKVPKETWAFYFGQYAIAFLGSGQVDLWEYCKDVTNAYVWRKRDSWQYCPKNRVSGEEHTLAIWPHVDDYGNKGIIFANTSEEAASFVSGQQTADANQVGTAEHAYIRNPLVIGTDQDLAGNTECSISDKMRYDMRRDLRMKVQVSTLGWGTIGYLVDLPGSMRHPYGVVPTVRMNAVIPSPTTLTATVNDAKTRSAFNATTDTDPYVIFGFTGDGTKTPVLYGYDLQVPPLTETISPGSFTATGSDYVRQLNEVSLTGAESDPSHRGGQLVVSDLGHQMPRLYKRGEFSVKVATTYTPPATSGDGMQTVTLFRGYAVRIHSTKIGKPGWTFPNPEARKFTMPLLGMWMRLFERVQDQHVRLFAVDATGSVDDEGHALTWKVTDAIKDLLYAAGFPTGEVNIPDLPFRLWVGQTDKNNILKVNSGSHFADLIVQLARDYLGMVLWWEDNAGTTGQWMLLGAPASTDPVVCHFVTTQATDNMIPTQLQGYPANTYPGFGDGSRTIISPNNNLVQIKAPVPFLNAKDQIGSEPKGYFNPKSYDVPGFTVRADPEDPNYIGRMRNLYFADAGVVMPTLEETEAAIMFKLARLGQIVMAGQQIEHFPAPLIFIKDAVTHKYRLLRIYDKVSYNGDNSYYVRNCNPEYRDGRVQLANYEIVKVNLPL